MRMYAEEDKGIVFFETILSLRKQKHTFIECIPVPWEQFDLLPGYFKVWCMYALTSETKPRLRSPYFRPRPNGRSIGN